MQTTELWGLHHGFAEQALRCLSQRVALVFVSSEDLWSHPVSGPSCLCGHYALFSCSRTSKKPNVAPVICAGSLEPTGGGLWAFSHIRVLLRMSGILAGPHFKDHLHCGGPLPKCCACSLASVPLNGLTDEHAFQSSSSPQLGSVSCRRCFTAMGSVSGPLLSAGWDRCGVFVFVFHCLLLFFLWAA